MTPPDIYPVSYVPTADGYAFPATKGVAGVGVGGTGGMYPINGGGFADIFRKDRAPTPAELLAENLNTAFACARLNAEAVAGTPLRLYAQTRKGNAEDARRRRRAQEWGITKSVPKREQRRLKGSPMLTSQLAASDDIEEIVEHPVLDLLDYVPEDPTLPTLTRFDLIFLMSQYLDLVGWGYLYTPRTGLGNTPGERWLVPPQLMRELIDPATGKLLYYQFIGASGQPMSLPVEDVVVFRDPDPTNPYRLGRSCLRAGIEKVRIGRKQDAATNAMLDNGSWPGGVFIPKGEDGAPAVVSPEEADRIRVALTMQLARAGRGGMLVAPASGTFEAIQIPPHDLADLESARMTKTDICNLFGVPNAKLERNDANRASADTADYAHAKDAILPRCIRLQSALNTLVRMYDPTGRLFLAFDSPVMEDRQHELENQKFGASIGAFLPSEWREDAGLPELPGADTRLATATVTALGPDGQPVQKPAPASDAKPGKQPPSASDEAAKSFSVAANALAEAVKGLSAKPDETALVLREVRKLLKEKNEQAATAAPIVATATTRHYEPGNAPRGGVDVVRGDGADRVANAVGLGASDSGVESKLSNLPHTPTAEVGHVEHDTGLAGPLPQGEDIARVMRQVFASQRAAVLDQLATKDAPNVSQKDEDPNNRVTGSEGDDEKDDGLPPAFVPLDEWTDNMAAEVKPLIEFYMTGGAKDIVGRIGASPDVFHVVNRYIPEAAQKLALKFCADTNATTAKQLDDALTELRQEISQGLFEGDTRMEMRDRVQKVFENADKDRAEMIGRTEASRARHEGEIVAAKESGVVKAKRWLRSADCCDKCDAIAEETKSGVPIDAPYTTTSYGPVMGPPLHPRCQCSQTFVLKTRAELEVTVTA